MTILVSFATIIEREHAILVAYHISSYLRICEKEYLAVELSR